MMWYYLETPVSSGSNVFRVGGESAFVGHGQATSDTGSRPVIEVPTKYIKYIDKTIYTLTLDAGTGATVDPSEVKVEDGKVINYLPTPEKTNYTFVDWYDGNTVVRAGDTVSSSKTLTAKWIEHIDNAIISPNSISVTVGGTQQLSITGTADLENYTVVSSSDTIASIDNLNVVTGNQTGSTTILITGETSGSILVVPVTVSPEQVVVTFDYNYSGQAATTETVAKGSTVTNIPSPTRSAYYFDGWHVGSTSGELFDSSTVVNSAIIVYAKWVPTISQATVTPNNIELTVNETGLDSATITLTPVSGMETYTITSSDSNVASVTSGGVVSAVAAGNATITYEGDLSHETITVSVLVNPPIIRHTVTFVATGYTVDPVTVIDGNTLDASDIQELSKDNFFFRGWFTGEGGTGDKLTSSTVIDSDKTYYAYFENIVCRAAYELHEPLCASKSSGGCRADGYSTSQKVTFGSKVTGDTLTSGNAFDCDVNGDGVYNPNTERFYYLRTDDHDNAVLLFSYNTARDSSDNLILNSDVSVKYGTSNTNPTKTSLPTTTEWTNVSLANPSHKIVNGTGTETSATVSYEGYAARTMTYDDINATGCYSGTATDLKANHCEYIYDNTGYIKESYRSYWLEMTSGSSNVYRAAGSNRNIGNTSYSNDTGSGVRPVIEVPITKLDKTIKPAFVITLNPDGGDVTSNVIIVNDGEALTTLTDPVKEDYIFNGWFIEGTDTLVTSATVPNASMTIVARWTYDAQSQIVEFRTTNDAMIEYYDKISTWKNSSANFPSWSNDNKSPSWALDATENTVMMQNFTANNCQCNDNQCSTGGTTYCDQPKGYDTGQTGSITIRLSDASTKTKTGQVITYAKVVSGVIYNLIPGEVYYWELDSDSSIYGYVKFTGERRNINAGDVRNVRDLGGLPVDSDGDGTIDGHIAYGRLFRGTKLSSSNSVTELTNLGINSQLDLREENSDAYKLTRYNRVQAQNYFVDPTTGNSTEASYYTMTRNAVKFAMQEIVDKSEGFDHNLYFHCRIGTDRTGTVAWVLEGLLGVPDEERIEDYELSFFYGLVRIHRYHNQKPGSTVGTGYERFTYMQNFMPTNSDIYDWYMYGSTNTAEDIALINAFKAEMIVSD